MSDLRSGNTVSASVTSTMRAMRKARGLTCGQLSELLAEQGFDISRQCLAKQEAGFRQVVSIDLAVALAKVFEVPIERLLEPVCDTCQNVPPPRFTCNECGSEGQKAS